MITVCWRSVKTKGTVESSNPRILESSILDPSFPRYPVIRSVSRSDPGISTRETGDRGTPSTRAPRLLDINIAVRLREVEQIFLDL